MAPGNEIQCLASNPYSWGVPSGLGHLSLLICSEEAVPCKIVGISVRQLGIVGSMVNFRHHLKALQTLNINLGQGSCSVPTHRPNFYIEGAVSVAAQKPGWNGRGEGHSSLLSPQGPRSIPTFPSPRLPSWLWRLMRLWEDSTRLSCLSFCGSFFRPALK